MNYIVSLILSFSIFSATVQAAGTAASQELPKVVVYTMKGCPGCAAVKSMFEDRNIPYEEIDVNPQTPSHYHEMIRKAGGKPGDQMGVPRIFIDDKHIGGYWDMSNDQLDALQARFAAGKSASENQRPQENKAG